MCLDYISFSRGWPPLSNPSPEFGKYEGILYSKMESTTVADARHVEFWIKAGNFYKKE